MLLVPVQHDRRLDGDERLLAPSHTLLASAYAPLPRPARLARSNGSTAAGGRWLYSVADDFFTKQLPHNVTWGLTVLYALDAPGDFADTAVQARAPPLIIWCRVALGLPACPARARQPGRPCGGAAPLLRRERAPAVLDPRSNADAVQRPCAWRPASLRLCRPRPVHPGDHTFVLERKIALLQLWLGGGG